MKTKENMEPKMRGNLGEGRGPVHSLLEIHRVLLDDVLDLDRVLVVEILQRRRVLLLLRHLSFDIFHEVILHGGRDVGLGGVIRLLQPTTASTALLVKRVPRIIRVQREGKGLA